MWKLSKSKTLIVTRKRLSAKGARHSFRRKIREGVEKAVDSSKPRYETPMCGDHWPESKRRREKATDVLSLPTTKVLSTTIKNIIQICQPNMTNFNQIFKYLTTVCFVRKVPYIIVLDVKKA